MLRERKKKGLANFFVQEVRRLPLMTKRFRSPLAVRNIFKVPYINHVTISARQQALYHSISDRFDHFFNFFRISLDYTNLSFFRDMY